MHDGGETKNKKRRFAIFLFNGSISFQTVEELPSIPAAVETPLNTKTPTKKRFSARKLDVTPKSKVLRSPRSTKGREKGRKNYYVNKTVNAIEQTIGFLPTPEQVDILTQCLKRKGMLDAVKDQQKTKKVLRKQTSFEKHKAAFDFYTKMSTPSTLTSRPPKLKMSEKPRIQENLQFVEPIDITRVRGKLFYVGQWRIIHKTIRVLHREYNEQHPDLQMSYGLFFALKPFYVRFTTEKDLEMCVCKKHLHARWAIQSLIENAGSQNIDLGEISSYETFFQSLTSQCNKSDTTYIAWECIPNKKESCEHIKTKWEDLQHKLRQQDDNKTASTLRYFDKVPVTTKKGDTLMKLRALKKSDAFFNQNCVEGLKMIDTLPLKFKLNQIYS